MEAHIKLPINDILHQLLIRRRLVLLGLGFRKKLFQLVDFLLMVFYLLKDCVDIKLLGARNVRRGRWWHLLIKHSDISVLTEVRHLLKHQIAPIVYIVVWVLRVFLKHLMQNDPFVLDCIEHRLCIILTHKAKNKQQALAEYFDNLVSFIILFVHFLLR